MMYLSNVPLLILLSRIAEADPFGHFVKQRSVPGFAVNSTVANSTAANSTTAVPTNTSTSEASQFSFIIPYDQTQACDIYGALCQTGSITVEVNLTSQTSTTVLPCSSYLSAQSSFLQPASVPDGLYGVDNVWPIEWQASFGRSPECRSYAQAIDKGQYTASNCGSGHTSVYPIASEDDIYPIQIPPGVHRYDSPARWYSCCGNCSLEIPEVRLYYFPDDTATNCHNNQTFNSTSVLSTGTLGKRMQSLVGDGGIAIVSGHTFTSPSLYLQVIGVATVADQCTGTVGPVLTDPIITFAPGQLSTWRPPPQGQWQYDNFTIGEIWTDWSSIIAVGDVGYHFPLEVKDLECPTWGLGRSTLVNGSVTTTIGPPFLPLIKPMMQVFALDPTWSAVCTGLLTDAFAGLGFEIFDPPMALTPGVALVPDPNQNSATTPHPSDAGPTTTPDPQVPRPTGVASPASSPVLAPALPTNSESKAENPVGAPPSPSLPEPTKSQGPPLDDTLLPQRSSVVDSDAQSPNSAQADPDVPSSVDPTTMLEDPQAPVVGATASAEPAEQNGDGSAQQTQDVGAIIYNALGRSDGGATHSNNKINTLTLPSTGDQDVNIPSGNQVISIQPSNIVLDGTTYFAGGPVMTLSDSVFTIVPQPGPLDSASVANNDPKANMPLDSDPLTIAGQPVVINPSTSTPNNEIISPNDPFQTLGGTNINQQQPAASITEIRGPLLPSVVLNPNPATANLLSTGGETSTAAISALSIAGTTISAGGPAVTVSGTIISLQSSGNLVMGPSTVDLKTAGSGTALLPDPGVPASATYDIAGLGVQVQPQSSIAVVNGATLSAGEPGVTVSGSLVSLEPGGKTLDVGTAHFAVPTEAADASYDIDGFSIQAQSQTSIAVVNGVTLIAGGPGFSISGSIVSLESGGKTLDVGTAHFAMPTEAADATYEVDRFNVQVDPQSSFAVIDGTTLSAGGPGITVSGSLVSLEQGGRTLDIGTAHFPLPTAAADTASPTDIDGFAIQPQLQSSIAIVDGVTLTAGAPGTSISGTLISLESGGKTLDIGTAHFALPTPSTLSPSPYNIDGFTIQPQPQPSSFAVVDGVTLSAGSLGISISGSLLSLESGGRTLDIGTGRFAIPTGVTNGTASGVQAFQGGGRRLEVSGILMVAMVGLGWSMAIL